MSRMPRLILAMVMALMGLGIFLGLAAAGTGMVTVDIQDDSDSCGVPPGYDVIGSATFFRNPHSNKLRVVIRLRGGEPSTLYTEYLLTTDIGPCDILTTLGTLRTNRKGLGSGRFTADVAGYSSFFVNSHDGTDSNDSAVVTLPGPH